MRLRATGRLLGQQSAAVELRSQKAVMRSLRPASEQAAPLAPLNHLMFAAPRQSIIESHPQGEPVRMAALVDAVLALAGAEAHVVLESSADTAGRHTVHKSTLAVLNHLELGGK